MSFDLVIFDCDGVLVDSEPIANRIFVEHLARHGIVTTLEEALRDLAGRSLPSCVALLERRHGLRLPPDFIARLQSDTMRAFESELRPVRGVRDALARITLPTCVASSSAPEKIRLSLRLTGLLPHFDGRLFSASEVARGKPHPDLFLHAAARMGHDPARCAVIEDAVPGAEAGNAAAMRVFAYAGAAHADKVGLAAVGARLFFDMDELPALLVD
ncbi:MAG TPA: HAD family hydrolase [Candidatus Cybelea sp.]|nr:HAD family hydrolase [Candidatus Cybelea sp.]